MVSFKNTPSPRKELEPVEKTKKEISLLKMRMKLEEFNTKEMLSEWESDISDELYVNDKDLDDNMNSEESSSCSEEEKKDRSGKGWRKLKDIVNTNKFAIKFLDEAKK